MSARKFWIKMNILYERFMLLVFTAVLLIIIYALYDSWYIYNKANIDLMKYKPAEGSSVPADAPITDDMVAWITMNDTNIDYPIMQGDNNLEFLNLPDGTRYIITESNYSKQAYKPMVSVDGGEKENKRSVNGRLSKNVNIAYENIRSGIIPTGVETRIFGAVLLLIILIAGEVLFVRRGRKRSMEDKQQE